MKKILASILTIVMLLTSMSACIIPASAETTLPSNYFFDETFEGYTADVDWDDDLAAAGVSGWRLGASSGQGTADSNAQIRVVTNPNTDGKAEGDKVLKISAGTMTSGEVRIRRNASAERTALEGKRLVYEADVYFDLGSDSTMGADSAGFLKAGSAYQIGYSTNRASQITAYRLYLVQSGKSGVSVYNRTGLGNDGKWHNIKYVLDVSETPTDSNTHIDTMRVYVDGIAVASKNSNGITAPTGVDATVYPVVEADGTTGRLTVDYFPSSSLDSTVGRSALYNKSAGGTVTDKLTGIDFGISAGKGYDYYIDNFKAYTVDKLTMTVSDNADNYEGGNITLGFNYELPSTVSYCEGGNGDYTLNFANTQNKSLKDLFTLKNSAGDVVEDGIKSATLSNENKSVDIVLGNFLAGEDYKIEINRFFKDVNGQGIVANSTDKEIAVHISDSYEQFAVTLDKTSITDFYQGKDAQVVATFTKDVSAVIADAVVVTKGDGTVVNSGWDYEISTDGKVVTFDFSGLETADYVVTLADGFAVGGEVLASSFQITITAEEDPRTVKFDETFESYETGKNWAAGLSDAGVTTGWRLATSAAAGSSTNSAADIQVIANPVATDDTHGIQKSSTDKVLKMSSGTMASGAYIQLRKTMTIERNAEELVGKRLVYEADVLFDNGGDSWTSTTEKFIRPMNRWHATYGASTGRTGGDFTNLRMNLVTGGSTSTSSKFYNRTGLQYDGKWHNIKYVVDVSENPVDGNTHVDTVRVYVDGIAVSSRYNPSLTDGTVSANYPVLEDDGTTGRLAVDYFPSDVDFSTVGGRSIGYSSSTYNKIEGIGFGITGTSNNNDKYYIDNLKAYLIDDLTCTMTGGNTTAYSGGNITFEFNHAIEDSISYSEGNTNGDENWSPSNAVALEAKDLFALKDSAGNLVENGIKSATFTSGGRKVDVVLDRFAAGATYTLEISRFLRDIYGQGINSNSTDVKIPVTIDSNYVTFSVSADKSSFTDFYQGKDTKVEATFTKAVTLDFAKNLVTVTNKTDDEVVAYGNGWTVTLSDDGKVATYDFSNLETADYEIKSDGYASLDGDVITTDFTVTITAEEDPRTVKFDETFESYETGLNWAAGLADAGVTTGWRLATDAAAGNSTNSAADIQVMANPVATDDTHGIQKSSTDKVLKMSSGSMTSGYIQLRKTMTAIVDGAEKGSIPRSHPDFVGKRLVYEADVLFDNGGDSWTSTTEKFIRPMNRWHANQGASTGKTGGDFANLRMYLATGGSTSTSSKFYNRTGLQYDGKWHNIKYVVDVSENPVDGNTHVDTVRVYVDGIAVSSRYNPSLTDGTVSANYPVLEDDGTTGRLAVDYFPSGVDFTTVGGRSIGYSTSTYNNIEGIGFGITGTSNNNDKYYIDNLKAYLIDDLDMDVSTNASEYAGGNITLEFNHAIEDSISYSEGNTDGTENWYPSNAETLEGKGLFTLKDSSGNVVENGIKNVTFTSGNRIVNVELDNVEAGKEYTIEISRFFRDIYGQGINSNSTEKVIPVTISVDYATDLFARATDAVVGDNKVTTNVTVVNPLAESKDVWAVVAAYGENNEMLGCEAIDTTTVDANAKAEQTVEVTVEDSSKVKFVKLFIWNSYTDMKPYHNAKTIFGASAQ